MWLERIFGRTIWQRSEGARKGAQRAKRKMERTFKVASLKESPEIASNRVGMS
jgi:hypothetical protein